MSWAYPMGREGGLWSCLNEKCTEKLCQSHSLPFLSNINNLLQAYPSHTLSHSSPVFLYAAGHGGGGATFHCPFPHCNCVFHWWAALCVELWWALISLMTWDPLPPPPPHTHTYLLCASSGRGLVEYGSKVIVEVWYHYLAIWIHQFPVDHKV